MSPESVRLFLNSKRTKSFSSESELYDTGQLLYKVNFILRDLFLIKACSSRDLNLNPAILLLTTCTINGTCFVVSPLYNFNIYDNISLEQQRLTEIIMFVVFVYKLQYNLTKCPDFWFETPESFTRPLKRWQQ